MTPAPYTRTVLEDVRISSQMSDVNFQAASADVSLTGAPFAEVKLVVDLATTCFPFDKWKTNPPPAGENWPADCDAFDRNFETALFESDAAKPGLELVRAITPFGGRRTHAARSAA